ncbi:MAG: hypothetical protein R3C49_06215 [Planctomycetaceae bacterium]
MDDRSAAVLSLVRHWADFAIILTLLVVNAVVGFGKSFRLEMRLRLSKRSWRWEHASNGVASGCQSRPAELVPGDLIRVRLGDIVLADARLLK